MRVSPIVPWTPGRQIITSLYLRWQSMGNFSGKEHSLEMEGPDYNIRFNSGGAGGDAFTHEIAIGEEGSCTDSLFIKAVYHNATYGVSLTSISHGFYLHQPTTQDISQSVKLTTQGLVISLGDTLVCLSWPELKLNWKLKPDGWPVFGFYDLEESFLLRGELCIHRINLQGEIMWSYVGMDIWVNIDGLPEVTILEDSIRLIDFESTEYLIDFNGKTLKAPVRKNKSEFIKQKHTWWQFWK